MLQLVKPDSKYKDEFIAMCRECSECSSADYGGWDRRFKEKYLRQDFNRFDEDVVQPLLDVENGRLAKMWYVPTEQMWCVDEDNHFIGFVDIRYKLVVGNETTGGNLGLFLRPSCRGKGIGKQVLNLAVAYAAQKDMDSLLVCCDERNVASRKTIEKTIDLHGGHRLVDAWTNGFVRNRFLIRTR